MRLPPLRIIAPVTSAVFLATFLLGILWFQLRSASSLIGKTQEESQIKNPTLKAALLQPNTDSRNTAVINIRRGDMFAMQGEWGEAEQAYQEAVRENGGIPALRKLAQAQLQRRNIRGAHATLEELKQAGTRPEDLLLLETIVRLRTGEIERARQHTDNAPPSPQKHYLQALIAIIEGNHERAKKELEETHAGWEPLLRSYAKILQSAYDEFALFPESPPIHLATLLARALAQVQECEVALPLLSQVTQQQDDYRDAWIVQGYCELTTERFGQALISLERAYSLDPEKPETQYFLARTYASLGNHRSALTFFQYALKNGFQSENDVRRRLIGEAIANDDNTLALDQSASLLKLDDATIDDLEQFVNIAQEKGRMEEAYIQTREGTKRWEENARVWELRGIAAVNTGKIDDAKTAFEQALKIDATRTLAKEELGKLSKD